MRDAEGSWRGTLQDAVAGWWEAMTDGCVCNRRSLHLIRANTSWELRHWTFNVGWLPWVSRFEVGVAAKPSFFL